LAARLRELRRAHGDPQRSEFVDQLGASITAIATYERGEREPSASVLAAYSETFGVNLHWLLTGEGETYLDLCKSPASVKNYRIDATVFKHVGRLVAQVYNEEGVKLPPDALLDEQSSAYNTLIEQAEDPKDRAELLSLLIWLETRIRKKLRTAKAEPGIGKHQA
jgi:transcriptional regulator with XRE-family HTH domain